MQTGCHRLSTKDRFPFTKLVNSNSIMFELNCNYVVQSESIESSAILLIYVSLQLLPLIYLSVILVICNAFVMSRKLLKFIYNKKMFFPIAATKNKMLVQEHIVAEEQIATEEIPFTENEMIVAAEAQNLNSTPAVEESHNEDANEVS